MLDGLQDHTVESGEGTLSQEAEGLPGSLQSHQLSPSQPVLQASTYMSGMEEKDRNHLSTLVDTAIIKVMKTHAVRTQLYVMSQPDTSFGDKVQLQVADGKWQLR